MESGSCVTWGCVIPICLVAVTKATLKRKGWAGSGSMVKALFQIPQNPCKRRVGMAACLQIPASRRRSQGIPKPS